MQTIIGCCGWSEGKAKYFLDFDAVELQSTFYEPPSVELARKWRTLAPASFHFCVKAWQLITHTPASPTYRRLKSKLSASEAELVGSFRPTEQVALAWERTTSIARALEARIVLFQCPASFRPERENINNLRSFFSTIRRDAWQLAWEPRGDWPVELVEQLCRDLHLIHCVDPFKAEAIASSPTYWRLHGRGSYGYRYSDQDLEVLSKMLATRKAQGDHPAYVLFNNIWMKEDGLRFQKYAARQSWQVISD